MKKTLIWIGLLSFFVILTAVPVFAQQAGTSSGQPRQSALDKSLQFKEKVATKSLELKGNIEERKQKFQENLKNFKDEKKRRLVERLHQRMGTVNKKATDILLKRLERLEAILGKIESRAQKKEVNGAKVTAVYTEIEAVNENIADLKDKIVEQADKVYDFDISDEQNVRSQAQPAVLLIKTDLKSLRDELVSIRKEMVDLVQMLAGIRAAAEPATGSANIKE